MANVSGGNAHLMNRANNQVGNMPAKQDSINSLINSVNVKKRFEEILGKKAAGFMSSVINVVNGNSALKACDPMSVIASASIAATLDLPVDPNLGFAYIIPYNGKEGNKAQFQLGYKGYVQLAMRTGLYKTMNVSEVYEGEIKNTNRITGEIEFDFEGKLSEQIIGYVAYFKLINGFEKFLYMTNDELMAHGKKFSKSFHKENGLWKKDPHSMCLKTVLKRLLSKYGILSIEMQTAFRSDQAVVNQQVDTGEITYDYIDAEGGAVDEGEGIIEQPSQEAEKQAPGADKQPSQESMIEKHRRMTQSLKAEEEERE
ncbi:MAG: rect: recombinase, phage RecT family [Firmicutes bacterium]|nr:rect: recombinase, phage RecT family [Bacillota bacterium]